MDDIFANVPEWCRPGAPAVVTVGADDSANSGARDMWRAVTITDVTNKTVTVAATRPYIGFFVFRSAGPDTRPYAEKPRWFLAPADAPDVLAQRRRRDEAKYGPGLTDQ